MAPSRHMVPISTLMLPPVVGMGAKLEAKSPLQQLDTSGLGERHFTKNGLCHLRPPSADSQSTTRVGDCGLTCTRIPNCPCQGHTQTSVAVHKPPKAWTSISFSMSGGHYNPTQRTGIEAWQESRRYGTMQVNPPQRQNSLLIASGTSHQRSIAHTKRSKTITTLKQQRQHFPHYLKGHQGWHHILQMVPHPDPVTCPCP